MRISLEVDEDDLKIIDELRRQLKAIHGKGTRVDRAFVLRAALYNLALHGEDYFAEEIEQAERESIEQR